MIDEIWNLPFWQNNLDFALIYGLFALAIYVNLAGGMLAVGSIAVGALTGFLAANLAEATSIPLVGMLVLGGAAGVLASLSLYTMLRRLTSHYMAMATIALVLVVRVVVLNASSLTGGAVGRSVDLEVGTQLLAVVVVIAALGAMRLRGSSMWLAFDAVRADADVAMSLGIDIAKVQSMSFKISGAVAGVAGVLLAAKLQYIGPDTYGIDLVFLALAGVVLGGAYHWSGAFIGSAILTAMPAFLSNYTVHGVQIINGLLILGIVIFRPHGIMDGPLVDRMRRLPHLVRRRRSLSTTALPVQAGDPT